MICVDGVTGEPLVQTTVDRPGSPASVTKLMTLLLVLEDIRAGRLALRSRVSVTKEAADTGGSQIWLAVGESFTVEELLYALMLKSANDVAVAMARRSWGPRSSSSSSGVEAKAAMIGP